MNPVRRLRFIAPVLTAGMLTASLLGSVTTASACSSPACLLQPDLTVGLTAAPNPVGVGGTHTYKLTVTNVTWSVPISPILRPKPVPGRDVSDVQVNLASFGSDELLVSMHNDTNSGFVCYSYPEAVGGMDTRCVSGSVPTGTTAQVTLTMRAPSKTGAYTTTATVDPYNQIPESNNTTSVGFSAN